MGSQRAFTRGSGVRCALQAFTHVQILEFAALARRDRDDAYRRNEQQVERRTSDDRARAELIDIRRAEVL